MRVEVLERSDGYTIAVWGGVMILLWRDQPSGAGIDRVQELLGVRAGLHHGGLVLVNVIPPRPPRPPDDATRAAMDRAAQHRVPGVKGVATIHEGGGFIGASIRALVSRMSLLRRGEPLRFFGSPAEAAAWAAELLGAPGVTGEGLAEAIRAARER